MGKKPMKMVKKSPVKVNSATEGMSEKEIAVARRSETPREKKVKPEKPDSGPTPVTMRAPFKMKNSMLSMSAKDGSPMQANYGGSPVKVLTKYKKLKKLASKAYTKFFGSSKTGYNPDLNPFSPKNQKGTKPTMEIPQNLKEIRDEYTNLFLKHGKLKGDK
tara:strand:+ start:2502 stop:2984 length:483 start_codon:yes stop_codon:yes gene_type:complete